MFYLLLQDSEQPYMSRSEVNHTTGDSRTQIDYLLVWVCYGGSKSSVGFVLRAGTILQLPLTRQGSTLRATAITSVSMLILVSSLSSSVQHIAPSITAIHLRKVWPSPTHQHQHEPRL